LGTGFLQREELMANSKDLDTIRASIDELDEKILAMINQRLHLAKKIGDLKTDKGHAVMDNARESMVMDRLISMNKGPLTDKMVQHFFAEIIAASREIQKPQQVGYLGPEATFTHIAAMNHFGSSVSFIPQPSIRDVFMEVEKDSCQYGVVPVENSIEGAVNYTLDLFYESDLKICSEIYQSISHDLLSKTGNLEDIQVIYSHPHAFAQCRKWLRKHLPACSLKECGSTASAAKLASENPQSAAISSHEAAQMYHLNVVASRIEDVSRNITRFLVIGKEEVRKTGRDKTSIMFVTAHIPGALYRILQPIAAAGLNMVKLESRPARHEKWSYVFFADFEGHMQDMTMKTTVEEMKNICLYLKWLGSYPRARDGF
jgi:chorismate mutase / prephenate dehydratase